MRVTVDGEQVSPRTLAVIEAAAKAAGVPRPKILQGSWANGDLSAGTHTGGGAVDLSVRGLTDRQQVALVTELRKRNGCAWLRTTDFGWTTGDHLHAIIRDEPALSAAAQKQVGAYDRNLNGLANRGRDPHPRPVQRPVEEVRLMAWPVGTAKAVNPEGTTAVPGGEFVNLATLDLPQGAKFDCSLQVRMPAGVAAGEAHLGRLGWAKAGEITETGHNPVPAASAVEVWRSPIRHLVDGGGRLAFRLWLPPRADGKPHDIRFVAKATRTH
jgi:hypothetical protein